MTTSTTATRQPIEETEQRARIEEAKRVERDLFFRMSGQVPNDERGRAIAVAALSSMVARVVAEMPDDAHADALEAIADMQRLTVGELVAAKRHGTRSGLTLARH